MKLTIEQYAAQADLCGLELVNAPRLEDVRYRVRADQTPEQAAEWRKFLSGKCQETGSKKP